MIRRFVNVISQGEVLKDRKFIVAVILLAAVAVAWHCWIYWFFN
jgi:hypothetical protein